MTRKRSSFGWTAKHHTANGKVLVNAALNKVIDGQSEAEQGRCGAALRDAAEAARVLGRAFQDFYAAGVEPFRQENFAEADKRLDALLANLKDHCLKG